MKKIGSNTVAVGFIAFGIIILLLQLNFQIGKYLINYWPVLFICFGGELLYESRKNENFSTMKYNKGIFLVIFLFLCAQGYYNVKWHVESNFPEYRHFININDIPFNSRSVNANTVIEGKNTKLIFNARNADLQVIKNNDEVVRFDGVVFKNFHNNEENTTLKSQIDKGVITINANTDDVYNVVGVLYVPKNLEITFNVDSLKVDTKEGVVIK
ncbi:MULTISPECIES: hypothetical protein [Clostridium]|uniref:LiaF transmembrane domain-containing protein n=1 Tax=Clostridium faecium TaxID=2762223 RepID=A0ABR8YQY4_9CLOT|nr:MULTISPECIES: hypothetical protein [Clostridium]MBD8046638.1 hypothetical protein [Clostridium faecium]MDU1349348.1 hypothetical protein [Clostridium argentinense]